MSRTTKGEMRVVARRLRSAVRAAEAAIAASDADALEEAALEASGCAAMLEAFADEMREQQS